MAGRHTVLTQSVTVTAAERVFLDAIVFVEGSANAATCDLHLARDGTDLIDVDGSVVFTGVHHPVAAAVMDTPGAGTFSYTAEIHDEAAGTCTVNPDDVESFLITEILAPNQ